MDHAVPPQDYAYLVIDRGPADRVTFPDGRIELHPPGSGDALVADWNAKPSEPSAVADGPEPTDAEIDAQHDELVAAWREETERALAALERETSSLGNPASRRASYIRRHPEPTRAEAVNALVRLRRGGAPAPRRKARSELVEHCWWAGLQSARTQYTMPVHEPGAVPRAMVAGLLSELSTDRWTVRDVQEDRIVVHRDGVSSALCVGLNVLLSRPGDEERG
jgi:hypothetical protein